MSRKFTALAFASAIMVTGCGGGGGDDGPTLTTLSEANATLASSVVYKAASALFDVAVEGPLGGSVGTVGVAPAGRTPLGLVPFVALQLSGVMGRVGDTSLVVGARFSETYDCSGGGSETIEVNDADNDDMLSNGDSVKISYANCVEEGLTFNGSIAVGDLVVTSDTVYTGKVTFDAFNVSGEGEVYGADGALTLSADETPGRPAVYQVSGRSLTTTYNGDEHRLQDFAGASTVDDEAGQATFNFEGRVSDSSNDVVVDAKTLEDFVALSADDYPSQGRMQITGDNSTRALLTALSATQVRIVVDENGDGSYETTLPDMSWDALASMQD